MSNLSKFGLYAWRTLLILTTLLGFMRVSGAFVLTVLILGAICYWLAGKSYSDQNWAFLYGVSLGVFACAYYIILWANRR